MSSNIPEARVRLQELHQIMKSAVKEIAAIEAMLYRKTYARKVVNRSRRISAALAEEIRIYHRKNSKLSQHEIAAVFNVNPGRVSESINGQW